MTSEQWALVLFLMALSLGLVVGAYAFWRRAVREQRQAAGPKEEPQGRLASQPQGDTKLQRALTLSPARRVRPESSIPPQVQTRTIKREGGGRNTPSLGRQHDAPAQGTTILLGPARVVRLQDLGLPQTEIRRRGVPLVVLSVQEPLWAEKGWRQEDRAYVGSYRVGRRHWPGRIETPYPGAYEAYIWNPPLRELEGHPHRPCFQGNGGNGRFKVHFRMLPSSLSHAITSIEEVLREAISA